MIRGVAGHIFNFGGVAYALDLMVPEAISKKLEFMLMASKNCQSKY